MVEQTVMEPVMTTETRKVMTTEYKQEQRERKYTVQRQVPRTEARTRTVNYSENQTQSREEKYTVSSQVTDMVNQDYTVQVPYSETRKGTRQVARTVTKDSCKTTPFRFLIRKPERQFALSTTQ